MEIETPEPSMQLLAEAAETQPPAPVPDVTGADDDSGSSSLSDIEDGPASDESDVIDELAGGSEDEDTEAETERLDPSPEKQRRQRKGALGAYPEAGSGTSLEADAADLPRTRSRGKTDIVHQEEDDQGDETNLQTSDMSSPAESAEASDQEESGKGASRKRKREEDDTTVKSLKKVALELANHVADQADAADGVASPAESADANEDAAMDDEDGFGNEYPGEEQAEDDPGNEDTQEAAEAADSNAEEAEGDDSAQDAASAARTQEELEKRKAALEKLSSIERDFALLRDKLFADRSYQLTQEMATIETEAPTHPLYVAVIDWLDQLRDEKIEQAKTLFRYKLGALQKRSTTNRASLQSQYMQRVRELRDESLEQASAEWYQIQRERRSLDTDTEAPINHFAGDRIQLVAGQIAYNTEVSILSGVSKYVGFPAAPEILGAKTMEIEEDLRKMGIARPAAPAVNPAAAAIPKQKSSVEEQFIADTPWANPQHQHSQFLTSIHRQMNNGLHRASPVSTPIAQRQSADQAPNGSASTIPALPTSSLGPTPLSGEASHSKTRILEPHPDFTPSKPSANVDSEHKTSKAAIMDTADAAGLEKESEDTGKTQQGGDSPQLLTSQSINDGAPLQGQFSQGTSMPSVKVGSV